jgi:hypothetical protein
MSKNPFLDLGFSRKLQRCISVANLPRLLNFTSSIKAGPTSLRRVNSKSRSQQLARSLTGTLRSSRSNSS